MWEEIDSARKRKNSARHLLPGTSEDPQNVDAVCLSQNDWPLACPCVDRHPTSEFRPAPGITLVHLPQRLILNWIGEVVAREYQHLKDSFTSGARVRDNVREDFSPYADATRIFEHSEDNGQTPEMDEWLTSAARTSDASGWYAEQKWDR